MCRDAGRRRAGHGDHHLDRRADRLVLVEQVVQHFSLARDRADFTPALQGSASAHDRLWAALDEIRKVMREGSSDDRDQRVCHLGHQRPATIPTDATSPLSGHRSHFGVIVWPRPLGMGAVVYCDASPDLRSAWSALRVTLQMNSNCFATTRSAISSAASITLSRRDGSSPRTAFPKRENGFNSQLSFPDG